MAERSPPPAPDPRDLDACRALLRRHARSFHAASLLLPRSVRDPASVLYGFCRIADDSVDAPAPGADPHAAIADLRARLARAYAGTPRAMPIDRALAVVLATHRIPPLLPERLIEGLAWDAEERRYETLADLFDYASRVAGTVGAMMALLMGARSASALARACDLGVAMQLSNIARDVAEDARMGRLYLPQAWLREAGIDPDAWLAAPHPSAALQGVVARLLAEADGLYARAAAGVAELPLACRPGINAARLLYAAIGNEVARLGPRALQQRASVASARRAWLLARAVATPWPLARGRHAPALPANDALVRCAAEPARSEGAASFVVDLFTRLERRDRLQQPLGAREGLR